MLEQLKNKVAMRLGRLRKKKKKIKESTYLYFCMEWQKKSRIWVKMIARYTTWDRHQNQIWPLCLTEPNTAAQE